MPGPKIPSPNSASDASTSAIASDRLGSLALQRVDELAEERRADADDDGQHHHLDAGGDHIAKHALGQKRCLVPQRERHEHETRQRRQLEFQHGDEKLNRQDEERKNDDRPSANSSTRIVMACENMREADQPYWPACCSSGHAA